MEYLDYEDSVDEQKESFEYENYEDDVNKEVFNKTPEEADVEAARQGNKPSLVLDKTSMDFGKAVYRTVQESTVGANA